MDLTEFIDYMEICKRQQSTKCVMNGIVIVVNNLHGMNCRWVCVCGHDDPQCIFFDLSYSFF